MRVILGLAAAFLLIFVVGRVSDLYDRNQALLGGVNATVNRVADQQARIENNLDELLKRLDKPSDSILSTATHPIVATPIYRKAP